MDRTDTFVSCARLKNRFEAEGHTNFLKIWGACECSVFAASKLISISERRLQRCPFGAMTGSSWPKAARR
jgi:hypothetical protein